MPLEQQRGRLRLALTFSLVMVAACTNQVPRPPAHAEGAPPTTVAGRPGEPATSGAAFAGSTTTAISVTAEAPRAGHGPATTTGRRGGPAPTNGGAARAPRTNPPPAPTGGCPDARTCPDYEIARRNFDVGADGRARIPYRINPKPPERTGLTAEQIVAAIRRATAAWTAVDPVLQFDFEGITDAQPYGFNNVVGFGPGSCGGGNGCAVIDDRDDSGVVKRAGGFNIILNSVTTWDWRPCGAQGEGPCEPYRSPALDLQDVVTHEWGHVLGLGHAQKPGDEELTMHSAVESDGTSAFRQWVTPGLGDILGVRAMYPCGCPMPQVQRP